LPFFEIWENDDGARIPNKRGSDTFVSRSSGQIPVRASGRRKKGEEYTMHWFLNKNNTIFGSQDDFFERDCFGQKCGVLETICVGIIIMAQSRAISCGDCGGAIRRQICSC
jgi:hypothetical protein